MKTGTACTQFSPLRRMRLSREKAGLSPKRKAKEKFFDAGINSLDRTVPRLEASGRIARGKKAGKLKVSKLLQSIAFGRRAAIGKSHGKRRLNGVGHGCVLRDERQKNLGKANQNARRNRAQIWVFL